ncbi:Uncharacterised protein [Chlamydia trachomatis]|nr:Uncharacterised protein [Chlamydia trachomatis]
MVLPSEGFAKLNVTSWFCPFSIYTLSEDPHAYMLGSVSFVSFESVISLLTFGAGAGLASRSVPTTGSPCF